jgi:hypothetical protein
LDVSSDDEGEDENIGRKKSANKATTKQKKNPASSKKKDSKTESKQKKAT